MLTRDIMTSPAVTVGPDASVLEVAKTLVAHRISGVPVVDKRGRLVGIVSEGDLMRRRELGTEPHQPWWMAFATPVSIDKEYHKAVADSVDEVMTKRVVTVREDVSIIKVAELLASHGVKCLPVVRGGECVGVVSRADLVRALALLETDNALSTTDSELLNEVRDRLRQSHISSPAQMNIIARDGVVNIWGTITDEALLLPLIDAIKGVPGVKVVKDHIAVVPPIWAE